MEIIWLLQFPTPPPSSPPHPPPPLRGAIAKAGPAPLQDWLQHQARQLQTGKLLPNWAAVTLRPAAAKC